MYVACLDSRTSGCGHAAHIGLTAFDEVNMRSLARIAAVAAWVGLLPSALYAQTSLAGTVKDASGAVLPGVTVEACEPGAHRKDAHRSSTDGTGQYRIENLRRRAPTP